MRVATVVVASLLAASCAQAPPAVTPAATDDALRGGTLRVALLSRAALGELDQVGEARFVDTQALHRCCLSRTLLAYSGQPTEEGGAEPRPDLAEVPPEVSADGLTWTFKLRPGLRYGPPLTDVEIHAQDVIRGMERSLRLSEQARTEFAVIRGSTDFAEGRADTIAGLEAPNEHTLVVRLENPSGDLGHRLSSPSSAPIPAAPSGARLGIADGHDEDWGGLVVSSGPYAVEGSDAIDFNLSPAERRPAAGYRPGTSIVLVRNPAWDSASDGLRPAYPDRIELAIANSEQIDEFVQLVEQGDLDLLAQLSSAPQIPLEHVERYLADPLLRNRLHVNDRNTLRALTMNVAVPPFDDVNVRRAVNWAVDKEGLIELAGGENIGRTAGHMIPDAFLNNLLANYDPYASPGSHGDLARARDEMRRSDYDSDGDGVCDVPACQGVSAVAFAHGPFPDKARLVAENLRPLGIELDLETLPPPEAFARANPVNRLGLFIGISWVGGSTASGMAELLSSRSLHERDNFNFSLLGARPEQLAEWGYAVSEVPSVDQRFEACLPVRGIDRLTCWAQLDRYLMEEVVPWVPYVFENLSALTSRRVVAYSYDQISTLPSFDRIAVADDR